MDVVRHEAVRNDCEASIGCGSHYLLQDDLNVFAHDEVQMPPMCAERTEIPVQADVIERGGCPVLSVNMTRIGQNARRSA
jgi:hypothetical protein